MKNRITKTIRMTNSDGKMVTIKFASDAPVEQYASRTGRLYAKIEGGEDMYLDMVKGAARKLGFKPLVKGRGSRPSRVGTFGGGGCDLTPNDPTTEFVVVTLAG